jgi:hypothetical protein
MMSSLPSWHGVVVRSTFLKASVRFSEFQYRSVPTVESTISFLCTVPTSHLPLSKEEVNYLLLGRSDGQ